MCGACLIQVVMTDGFIEYVKAHPDKIEPPSIENIDSSFRSLQLPGHSVK